jgi:hypothetical protein
MRTNTEFEGYEYDTCIICGNQELAFTLTKGQCLKCEETR